MKKILIGLVVLGLTVNCYSAPSNSISIPNSFSANTTISSSESNANNNEIQTKYNAHNHIDLTQIGTITTGAWAASVIDEAYGGTGSNFSSTAQGNTLYFSGTGTISALAPGTSGYFLKTQGASADPVWAAVPTATVYTDRGDAAAVDYSAGTLTQTSYTDLDLSSIVSDGAKAVLLRVAIASDTIADGIRFRENGNSNDINNAGMYIQVSLAAMSGTLVVGCDTNRVIEYAITKSGTLSTCNVTVMGWWN